MFGDLTTAASAIAWAQPDPVNNPLSAADQLTITSLVTPASDDIRAFCNRWLGPPVDFQELRDGYGGGTFSFAQFPCQAVLAVVIGQSVTVPPVGPIVPAPANMPGGTFQGVPFSNTPYKAGYMFTPTRLSIQGYYVPRWPMSVLLQYTAGYPTIPTDLAQACNELIASAFRERQRVGVEQEEAQGIGSQTYIIGPMPGRVQRMLMPYKRVAPVSAYGYTIAPTATDPATLVGAI